MDRRNKDHKTQRPDGKKRALFDTNIWRYVVDSKSQGPLIRLARTGSYQVQIAPAVLYETLRLKDAPLRTTLVKLMTNTRFQRLMPEAYSESVEILFEIQRLRPDWFRDTPDLHFNKRLEKDWRRKTGGFWVDCARPPDKAAQFLANAEGDTMREGLRAQAKRARREMIEAEWNRNPPMDKSLAKPLYPVPGWRGDWVEAWRIDAWTSMTYFLALPGNAYYDWIAPFIKVDEGLLWSPAWVEFWLYLTDKSELPRQWMRWAHSFAQRFRKTTSGSPGDSQLSTYFLETDVVVTADKALLEILEECRPYAPCQLPDGKLVPAGAPGVRMLLQLLEA